MTKHLQQSWKDKYANANPTSKHTFSKSPIIFKIIVDAAACWEIYQTSSKPYNKKHSGM